MGTTQLHDNTVNVFGHAQSAVHVAYILVVRTCNLLQACAVQACAEHTACLPSNIMVQAIMQSDAQW
jgi:hypothetical protein